jgi:hypothetical protein
MMMMISSVPMPMYMPCSSLQAAGAARSGTPDATPGSGRLTRQARRPVRDCKGRTGELGVWGGESSMTISFVPPRRWLRPAGSPCSRRRPSRRAQGARPMRRLRCRGRVRFLRPYLLRVVRRLKSSPDIRGLRRCHPPPAARLSGCQHSLQSVAAHSVKGAPQGVPSPGGGVLTAADRAVPYPPG